MQEKPNGFPGCRIINGINLRGGDSHFQRPSKMQKMVNLILEMTPSLKISVGPFLGFP